MTRLWLLLVVFVLALGCQDAKKDEEEKAPEKKVAEGAAFLTCQCGWDAAQSESERLGLLAGFEEALISGDWSVPTDGGVMLPLLEIARVALDAPDVDATRVARVLGLAREMQRRGHLLTFFVGTSLATDTLERCRAEPSLVPSDLDLPPPRPSELFEALCRDHVIAGETWAHEPGGLPPGGGALPALSGGDEVVARALRSALVHDARRLHPLRDTPERFGELAPPAVPGLFLRLRAACLARPADLRALLAPLIAVDMAAHGRRWTEFVAEWNAVLRG